MFLFHLLSHYTTCMSVLPAGLVVGQHEGDLRPEELHRPGALLYRVLHQHIANPHEEVSSQQQPTKRQLLETIYVHPTAYGGLRPLCCSHISFSFQPWQRSSSSEDIFASSSYRRNQQLLASLVSGCGTPDLNGFNDYLLEGTFAQSFSHFCFLKRSAMSSFSFCVDLACRNQALKTVLKSMNKLFRNDLLPFHFGLIHVFSNGSLYPFVNDQLQPRSKPILFHHKMFMELLSLNR